MQVVDDITMMLWCLWKVKERQGAGRGYVEYSSCCPTCSRFAATMENNLWEDQSGWTTWSSAAPDPVDANPFDDQQCFRIDLLKKKASELVCDCPSECSWPFSQSSNKVVWLHSFCFRSRDIGIKREAMLWLGKLDRKLVVDCIVDRFKNQSEFSNTMSIGRSIFQLQDKLYSEANKFCCPYIS